jgi:hypothetical protein
MTIIEYINLIKDGLPQYYSSLLLINLLIELEIIASTTPNEKAFPGA